MVTGTAVPVEEYLRTSYEPDMEYVDGQLVERSVGERRHSRTQTSLIRVLSAREAERGFEVFVKQRIVTQPRRRYRVPDVCAKAVPHNPTPVVELPDLVIEVLSPDDTLAEAAEKCTEYFRFGDSWYLGSRSLPQGALFIPTGRASPGQPADPGE